MTTLLRSGKLATPTGYKVRASNYNELEHVASELRPMLPKVPGDRYRIDCRKVLEKTLPQAGFYIHVSEVSNMPDCAAFTIPDDDLIVFREDIYDLVQTDNVYGRSTVIHEMSHIVLKHAATLHRGSPAGRHRHFEDSEWQAKALTAAIMMPINVCRTISSASALARACGTSVQAAGYRLERLVQSGLIKPKDFYRGPI